MEKRLLYCYLVYNWETRQKTFMSWEDGFKFDVKTLGPDDYFYIIDVDLLPPDTDKKFEGAHGIVMRQLYPEKPRDPMKSLLQELGPALGARITASLPAGTFGPGIGYLDECLVEMSPKRWVEKFSVPGHFFKVTLEHVTEEEYKAIPQYKMT